MEADLTKIMEEGHSYVALDQDHNEVRTLFSFRLQTEETDIYFPFQGLEPSDNEFGIYVIVILENQGV